MATKNQILSNPLDFSVEELYEAIQDGIITYDELCELQDFSSKRRNQLGALINGAEDDDWAKTQSSGTIDSYTMYMRKYPHGNHVVEARSAIENIRLQEEATARREAERTEWEAVPAWDIDAIRKFINAHPDSPYLQQANQLILELQLQEEESAWSLVVKDNVDSLYLFIQSFPYGIHVNEARQLLNDILHPMPIDDLLETIRNIEANKKIIDPIGDITNSILSYLDKGRRNTNVLMDEIRKNKNLLAEGVIRKLLSVRPELDSYLQDAVGANFMKALNNRYSQQAALPTVITPDKIERTSTEFYFWGIPASGKTCLMASLLSAANRGLVEDVKGMSPDVSCSGYNYLTYLMDFFSGEGNVLRLMPGNGQGSVAEMGFNLIDSKKHSHPITFIDMPGEAFKAMHKELAHDSNNPFKSDLDVVNKLLVDKTSNSNQKVHIFVVEYGAHNKKDADGISQQIYLQSATSYIKSKGIFNKRTDMICIIFTKADLAEGGPENFNWKDYLTRYYHGFYTNLCEICDTNEINNGEPVKFWFSIGDVCFRSYCQYNEDAAHKVLNFIVDRTWRQNKLRGIFSK